MRMTITGNCQVASLAAVLRVLIPSAEIDVFHLGVSDINGLPSSLSSSDVWLRMPIEVALDLPEFTTDARVLEVPAVNFAAFFPDLVYATTSDGGLFRGLSDYHSAIGLWAWKRGVAPSELERLMTADVMNELNYRGYWQSSYEALSRAFDASSLDFKPVWRSVKRSGVFMHTLNHPTISTVGAVAQEIVRKLGFKSTKLSTFLSPIERVVADPLAHITWPVYPFVASYLGVPGGFQWRVGNDTYPNLESWAEATWKAYEDSRPSNIVCPRIDDGTYDRVLGNRLDGSLRSKSQ